MKRYLNEFKLFVGKLDRRNIQLLSTILTIALLVTINSPGAGGDVSG